MWKRANGRVEDPVEFAVAEYLVINLSRKEIGISHWKLQNLADGHCSLLPVAGGRTKPAPDFYQRIPLLVRILFAKPKHSGYRELLIPQTTRSREFFLNLEPQC